MDDTVRDAVKQGLLSSPKSLPGWYMYDQEGSVLCDNYNNREQYYMARAELEILRQNAKEIVDELACPTVVVDLGSGNSVKTKLFLNEILQRQPSLTFYPVDISAEYLQEACSLLSQEYGQDRLRVKPIAEDYNSALKEIAKISEDKSIICLGSLQGMPHDDQVELLKKLSTAMSERDRLIVSLDITQDRSAIERAYKQNDDPTKELAFNSILRLNREFGKGEMDTSKFGLTSDVVVDKDPRGATVVQSIIVSACQQSYNLDTLGVTVDFKKDEKMCVAQSYKYTVDQVEHLVAQGNQKITRMWKDKQSHVGIFCMKSSRDD